MSKADKLFTDGKAYERLMGRWSRLVGETFLDWLDVPNGLRWLDVGCGNGAFTEELIARCTPDTVTAVDPADDQLAYARSLAEFNANNALWLRKLRDEGTVKIARFDDSVLKAFLAVSQDVVAEAGSGDELSRKIYASYQQFRVSIMDWSDIAEGAFLNSRRLA